jgi:hypothetical protein
MTAKTSQRGIRLIQWRLGAVMPGIIGDQIQPPQVGLRLASVGGHASKSSSEAEIRTRQTLRTPGLSRTLQAPEQNYGSKSYFYASVDTP